jgi:Tol biopolymer transport system component/CubicO group peptidase (beta-lactamase class C family)
LAADLQRTLDRQLVDQRFPGLSAAVVLPDGHLWAGGSGYTEIDTRRRVTPHTVFALASMSKAFVSVLAADLAADGVLPLDHTLDTWVPEFPNAEHITIQQLLTATSGITDDNDHPFTAVDDDPSRRWTLQEFLDRVPPPVCAPGSCRSGNENAPFVLVGTAIERATGSSLATLYRQRFFRPLGLGEIFLQAEEPVRGEIAAGYQDDGSGTYQPMQGPPGPLTTSWATSVGGAAASMASSAEDVALWTHALFGGSLIDPKALATIGDLTKLSSLVGSYECAPAGLGFGASWFDGREVRLANGGIPGFVSALAHFPHEGLTVVALGNRSPRDEHDPAGIQEVRDALARVALAHLSPPPPATTCNVDVYSVRADGSEVERLTVDSSADGLPSWSPSGGRIAFGSNRDGNFEVYVMNADGSEQTNRTNDPGSDKGGSWSPDGRRIAFPSDRDGDREIYVMNADGSGLRRLTRNDVEESSPAWSPDGRHIAFTLQSAGSSDIYVMNIDGSGIRRLTREADVRWGPTWSPDGTMIAFEAGDPRYAYAGRIFTIRADGSGMRSLIADPAGDHQPAWGPNGLIAFSSDGDIFAIRPDGTGRIQITSGWPMDLAPAWSPDGSRIVFASERREPG